MKPECIRHFKIHLVSFTSVHTSHVHDVLGQAYKRRLIARQGDNFREISDQTQTFFFFFFTSCTSIPGVWQRPCHHNSWKKKYKCKCIKLNKSKCFIHRICRLYTEDFVKTPHTLVSDLGNCSKVLFDRHDPTRHLSHLMARSLAVPTPTAGFSVPLYPWSLFYKRSAFNWKKNIIVPDHMLSPRYMKKKETHSVSPLVFREKRNCLCVPSVQGTGGKIAFSPLYSWRAFPKDSNVACWFSGWRS